MIERQLRRRGIKDERVLAAMGRVPREEFVPAAGRGSLNDDCACRSTARQTISQPVIVAMMTEALQLPARAGPRDRHRQRLPVGDSSRTGGRGLLDRAARRIVSPSRPATVAGWATGISELRVGDGSLGWQAEAPFRPDHRHRRRRDLSARLWEQLAEGGILVGPFGPSLEQGLYEILQNRRPGPNVVCSPAAGLCRWFPMLRRNAAFQAHRSRISIGWPGRSVMTGSSLTGASVSNSRSNRWAIWARTSVASSMANVLPMQTRGPPPNGK